MSKLGARGDGSFGIMADRMGELNHRVEVLNRRVKKLGVGGLSIEQTGYDMVKFTVEGGQTRLFPIAIVRIVGQVPVIAGYKFAARIEHLETGNIISKAPGYEGEIGAEYRECKANCNHCSTFRYRNDTFLLEAMDGRFVQVGRNCLQDFLRSDDVAAALKLFSLLQSIVSTIGGMGEVVGSSASEGGHLPTLDFLATTAAVIREHGWVSKASSYETGVLATAKRVDFVSGPCPKDTRYEGDWRACQPTDADFAEAGAIVEWAAGLEGTDNDYLHNLHVACALGYVESRHMGIVASAVVAYRRAHEVKPAVTNKHVGKVGERLELELRITRISYGQSQYGTTTIYTFVNADGCELTWFSSRDLGFKVGDVVVGKASIKKHDSFRGVLQTHITRGSFEAKTAKAS